MYVCIALEEIPKSGIMSCIYPHQLLPTHHNNMDLSLFTPPLEWKETPDINYLGMFKLYILYYMSLAWKTKEFWNRYIADSINPMKATWESFVAFIPFLLILKPST